MIEKVDEKMINTSVAKNPKNDQNRAIPKLGKKCPKSDENNPAKNVRVNDRLFLPFPARYFMAVLALVHIGLMAFHG
jgi:hypothetical protein